MAPPPPAGLQSGPAHPFQTPSFSFFKSAFLSRLCWVSEAAYGLLQLWQARATL